MTTPRTDLPDRRRGIRRSSAVDVLLWLLAAAMVSVLVILSIGPQPPTPPWAFGDKLLHVAAYAGTTFVLLLAAVWRPGRGAGPFPRVGLVIALALALLGAGLELVQGLEVFGPRSAEPGDAIANTVGVAIGWGLWQGTRQRAKG